MGISRIRKRCGISSADFRTLISVGLVIALGIIFSLSTTSFLSARNIYQLLRDSAYVGIIALGLSFVMIGGGIDLSAGGIVCLAGLIGARVADISGVPGIVAVFAAVLAGAVCGLVNAYFVTKVHLTEFVTTLASGFVFVGLGLMWTFRENGRILAYAIQNDSFSFFGGKIGGIFYITIAWIVLAIVVQIVLMRTKFGLYTYALGSNAKSAGMSGINNSFVKGMGFVLCGSFCGLAAAFSVAYQNSTSVALGSGMEFQAIAACVVGGIVLGGGHGNAIGAFLGGLFMTLVMNGLYKYGLSTCWQSILQGAIIIAMTSFDAQFFRLCSSRRIRAIFRL